LPAAAAGINSSICLNGNTIIGAVPVAGSTYSWSSVPAGFSSTSANPSVSPLVNTTFKVTETIVLTGCTNTNTVLVTINPLPAANAGPNRTICAKTTTNLGASAITGSTYSWSSVPAGFTSSEANPEIIPLVTTTYTVVETNTETGCINTNSVLITVNPLPASAAGADRGICPGSTTTLGAVAIVGNTYSWSSLPAGFTSTEAMPIVNPSESTTYTLVETITATGCTNTKDVVVTLNPLPAANAGTDRSICLNTSTTLGASAVTGSIYSWSSVPTGSLPTIAEPIVNPTIATKYTLTETITATGCTSTNSIMVTVNPLTGDAGVITGPVIFTRNTTGVVYSVGAILNATNYKWKYTGTGVTINGTGTEVTLDFSATASSGSLTVKGNNDCGDGAESSLGIGDTKRLVLGSVMLQGLYLNSSTMNPAQDEYGDHWPSGVADHIDIELHSAVNGDYSTIVYTAIDIPLSTSGIATITLPGNLDEQYYITIKHRNSLETASANAISFTGSYITVVFDKPEEVFGENIKPMTGGYAIYVGEQNFDGLLDASDLLLVYKQVTKASAGYLVEDINGDGLIDASDLNMQVKNVTLAVGVLLP